MTRIRYTKMGDKFMSVRQFPSNIGLLHIEIWYGWVGELVNQPTLPDKDYSYIWRIFDDAGHEKASDEEDTILEAKKQAKLTLIELGIQFHDEVRQGKDDGYIDNAVPGPFRLTE